MSQRAKHLKAYLVRTRFPLSFRQLLLMAFLSIVILLSGALARTLFVIEKLAEENREYPMQALALADDVRTLQNLTVVMERNARQYYVLGDPSFREEFRRAWEEGKAKADGLALAFASSVPQLPANWRSLAEDAAARLLRGNSAQAHQHAAVLAAFQRLGEVNQQINRASRELIAQRTQALAADLQRQRNALIFLGVTAATVAMALSLGFGVWLSWSFEQLAIAVETLGGKGLEADIIIGGPTDIRALGQRIDMVRQRLAALEADKQLFLRHVSHELKTPLANLREGVAVLEDEVAGPLNAKQSEVVVILRENTLSLQGQIEDLLQYNAAAFYAGRLDLRRTDLLALLSEISNQQRLQCQARSIQVEIVGAARPLPLDTDKMRMAIGNLLSNAIRFSPDGGHIRFALADTGFCVTIDCIDNGSGIDPEDRHKVFDPFYQGRRQVAGVRKGNGIGLSIVKELVEAHAGKVVLLPSEAGAHFRIEIPIEK